MSENIQFEHSNNVVATLFQNAEESVEYDWIMQNVNCYIHTLFFYTGLSSFRERIEKYQQRYLTVSLQSKIYFQTVRLMNNPTIKLVKHSENIRIFNRIHLFDSALILISQILKGENLLTWKLFSFHLVKWIRKGEISSPHIITPFVNTITPISV